MSLPFLKPVLRSSIAPLCNSIIKSPEQLTISENCYCADASVNWCYTGIDMPFNVYWWYYETVAKSEPLLLIRENYESLTVFF
jgi:hypothetical protein